MKINANTGDDHTEYNDANNDKEVYDNKDDIFLVN